jgi:hypothetical protein
MRRSRAILSIAALLIAPLAIAQQATTLYEWTAAAGADGWTTSHAPAYGWGEGTEDLLDFDPQGWIRSWSAGDKLWWPDGNHACYHPFLDKWTIPPCTGWISIVAYRMTPNQADPAGSGFPFGDAMDFRKIRVTLSARARTDGETPEEGDIERIKNGTGWYTGLHNYNPARLYLWAQTVIGNRAYNYTVYMQPFDIDWNFPDTPVTRTFTTEDWTCLGAGVVASQQEFYGCKPPSVGLAGVNRDWGFLLIGIDPRDSPQGKPIGSVEIKVLKVERLP